MCITAVLDFHFFNYSFLKVVIKLARGILRWLLARLKSFLRVWTFYFITFLCRFLKGYWKIADSSFSRSKISFFFFKSSVAATNVRFTNFLHKVSLMKHYCAWWIKSDFFPYLNNANCVGSTLQIMCMILPNSLNWRKC